MARTHDDNVMAALDQWEPAEDSGLVARAASFLHFAAKKRAGVPISWSLVTKRVLSLPRMPNPDSQVVLDMMRRASAIRVMLGRDYSRGLENISGLGVRATADDDDFVATQINTQVFIYPTYIYLILGLTYFVLCFSLSRFAFWLERRLANQGGRDASPLATL